MRYNYWMITYDNVKVVVIPAVIITLFYYILVFHGDRIASWNAF